MKSIELSPRPVRIDTEDQDVRELAKRVQTPAILLDLGALRRRVELLAERSGCTILYALKSNPHEAVLREIMATGEGFDVASGGELTLLRDLGVRGERIFFSSIAKTMQELRIAREMGVRRITADSHLELDKIKDVYPEASVLIRMSVTEPSARVPLSNRFGVNGEQFRKVLCHGRKLGLSVEGIALHVGSQCMDRNAWGRAVSALQSYLDPSMNCVALGGGFPIEYRAFGETPSLAEMSGVIARAVRPLTNSGLDVFIEPGRLLAGPIGTLVTTVTLVKPSVESRKWLFLDVGAYNSLQIVCEGFDFLLQPLNESREPEEYDICGPSCHSRDVFNEPVTMPAQRPGDRLLVINAGAYTIPFITDFCGNARPHVEIISG